MNIKEALRSRARAGYFKPLIAIVALLLLGGAVYAVSDVAHFCGDPSNTDGICSAINGNGFGIPVGSTARVDTDKIRTGISARGCRLVTNTTSSPKPIFVPTDSAAEWDAFVDNHPSYVTLATCPTGPTCSVTIQAGGLGNGNTVGNAGTAPFSQPNFVISRTYMIGNSASSGNCSMSGTTQIGSNSDHFDNSSFSYTAIPGQSGVGYAGNTNINNSTGWSLPQYDNFYVETKLTSLSCPSGTPDTALPVKVSCTLQRDASGNMIDCVNDSNVTKTINCI